MKIKTVAVLGANGTMGRNIAAIFASFGKAKVFLATRSLDKSKFALEKAYQSVRCESIKERMVPVTYDDIQTFIPECDLIFESLKEDFDIKKDMYKRVIPFMKDDAILATGTSGLSIDDLSVGRELYGIHMFNPPYNLSLCELIGKENPELEHYLANVLKRTVVKVKDSPSFLGNRIGFYFINKAMKLAEVNKDQGGIDYIDAIFGGFTGRSMSPLVTADFVGLDVHKSIVDYVYKNTMDKAFICPDYLNALVDNGYLGKKSGKGLYYYDKDRKLTFVYDIRDGKYRLKNEYNFYFSNKMIELIQTGDYQKAYQLLIDDECVEAVICKTLLLEYIVYSLKTSLDVSDSISSCDDVMATGFAWIPPIALIEVFGGKETVDTLVHKYLGADLVKTWDELYDMVPNKSKYDYRPFLKGRY